MYIAQAISALKTPEMVDAVLREVAAVNDEQMGEMKLMVVVGRTIPRIQNLLRGDDAVCAFAPAELVSFTKEFVQSVFNERLSANATRVACAILGESAQS